jgi:hypothetical protein
LKENNVWREIEKIGDFPDACYGHSAVVYQKSMYIYGGFNSSGFSPKEIFEFNFGFFFSNLNSDTFQWKIIETKTGIIPQRFNHACVLKNDSMFVSGGIHEGENHLDDLCEYSFLDNSWKTIQTKGEIPEKSFGHHLFIFDHKIHWIGSSEKNEKSIFCLDSNTLEWKYLKEYSSEKFGTLSRIIFHNGTIYHFGGYESHTVPHLLNQSFKIVYSDEIIYSNEKKELSDILKVDSNNHHFKMNEALILRFDSISEFFTLTNFLIQGDDSLNNPLYYGILFVKSSSISLEDLKRYHNSSPKDFENLKSSDKVFDFIFPFQTKKKSFNAEVELNLVQGSHIAILFLDNYDTNFLQFLKSSNDLYISNILLFGYSSQILKSSHVSLGESKNFTNQKELVIRSVKKDGNFLKFASKDLQNEKEVVLEAVKSSSNSFEHASQNLKKDIDVVIAAVKSGYPLIQTDKEFWKIKELAIFAIVNQKFSFKDTSIQLKDDKEVVMEAVKKDGENLKHASKRLKGDKEVVIQAIVDEKSKDSLLSNLTLSYASKEIQHEKDVVLLAVSNRFPLNKVVESLRYDKEIIHHAIMNDYSGMVFKNLPEKFKSDKSLTISAISNGVHYSNIHPSLMNDRDIIFIAIKRDCYCIKWIDESILLNHEFFLMQSKLMEKPSLQHFTLMELKS